MCDTTIIRYKGLCARRHGAEGQQDEEGTNYVMPGCMPEADRSIQVAPLSIKGRPAVMSVTRSQVAATI